MEMLKTEMLKREMLKNAVLAWHSGLSVEKDTDERL
jgi:hypothetical protein